MIDPQLRDDAPVATTDTVLRQFAGLWILFFGGLACWQGLWHDRTTLGAVCAGLAALVGLPGLIHPQAIRPVFTLAMAIAMPIGLVVSKALLLILFYGLFTLVGVIFRLIGRDALRRRFQPGQPSYWMAKPAAADIRSYFRQS